MVSDSPAWCFPLSCSENGVPPSWESLPHSLTDSQDSMNVFSLLDHLPDSNSATLSTTTITSWLDPVSPPVSRILVSHSRGASIVFWVSDREQLDVYKCGKASCGLWLDTIHVKRAAAALHCQEDIEVSLDLNIPVCNLS
jgi:hypothetical protein